MNDFDLPSFEPIRRRSRFHKPANQYGEPIARCNGKNSFSTVKAAEKKRQRLLNVLPYLRVYKCRHCPYFHLTSQRPRA